MRRLYLLVALATLHLSASPYLARGAEPLPKQLTGVEIAEHLGKPLALDIPFTDHEGRAVKLRRYFSDGKPVLLTLNYYRCKTLCSLQLNAVVNSLKQIDWTPGREYRVVTISIDPREGPTLAKEKRTSYLRALGKGNVDWSFLVGKKVNIDRVARAVGFRYRYIAKEDQYAHPAAIYVLSPTGVIARYLYGIAYPPRQVRFAMVEASAGRVGSTVDKIILSCFHYDATVGAYGPFAFGIMRLAGIATVIVLGSFLLLMWVRDKRRASRLLI